MSTGYKAEQAIVAFLPVDEATLVIHTNRTSTDQVAGFGGGAKRTIDGAHVHGRPAGEGLRDDSRRPPPVTAEDPS